MEVSQERVVEKLKQTLTRLKNEGKLKRIHFDHLTDDLGRHATEMTVDVASPLRISIHARSPQFCVTKEQSESFAYLSVLLPIKALAHVSFDE